MALYLCVVALSNPHQANQSNAPFPIQPSVPPKFFLLFNPRLLAQLFQSPSSIEVELILSITTKTVLLRQHAECSLFNRLGSVPDLRDYISANTLSYQPTEPL